MTIPADALREVLRQTDRASVDALPSVVVTALAGVGVRGVILYLLDYDERLLLPAPGSISIISAPEPQAVPTSPAGEACARESLIETRQGDIHKVWVAVTQRADCLGVLELELDEINDELRQLCSDLGVLLGHLLVTAHKYTDVYELLARRRDMNLAAEMHWEVQPALSYAGPHLRIAGGIEPAYEVGGDAFDYNVNRGVLDFALLDAMGHGLEAALLSFQAISSYRYGRRRLQSLDELAQTLEKSFIQQFGGERFVTGLLCRLDYHTGEFRWVNAAHLPPLLMRKGKVEQELTTPPCCPLGLGLADDVEVHDISIDPGDGIVLYSDGVVEARSPGGEIFELERLRSFIEREATLQAPPATVVRNIINEVKQHSAGHLRDDATLVLLDYIGD